MFHQVDYWTTAEIVALTVNTTEPLGLDFFLLQTFEANAIGKEGRDNGVLIVVSTDERAWGSRSDKVSNGSYRTGRWARGAERFSRPR